MRDSSIPLEQIQIAAPCRASWQGMTGNGRVRHCGQCDKNVYNLSGMTRTEAETLVQRTEGRLCVRFYRRADGTILTQDCPVGLAAFRRRAAVVGVVAAAFIFAALSFVTAGAFVLRGLRDGGERRLPQPMQTVMDWIFPPTVCVMGSPAPIAPVVAPNPPAAQVGPDGQ